MMLSRGWTKLFSAAVVVGIGSAVHAGVEPGIDTYHVGVDLSGKIVYGAYEGLDNPNYNRLTFFLSHTFSDRPAANHFHRIGSYGLGGDPASPEVVLSSNNRLPEPYQGDDGLSLLPGSGVFGGKLVSGLGPSRYSADDIEQEYGDFTIRPMDVLMGYDEQAADLDDTRGQTYHPGHYLVNTSGGVYKTSIADAKVALELTALSDGLGIYEEDGDAMFNAVGDQYVLGMGDDWSVLPVFAVNDGQLLGSTFSATFKLVDVSDAPTYDDSAEFSVDFVVVPEPASLILLSLGGIALIRRRRLQA